MYRLKSVGFIVAVLWALLIFTSTSSAHPTSDCASMPGGAKAAAPRALAFAASLTPEQRKVLYRPFNRETAIGWSNLPIGLVPRVGIRLGDLSAKQIAAFDRLLETVLSRCGIELLAEVRMADGILTPMDSNNIGWNPANYYAAFVGVPSRTQRWILQVGGHHIAYNLSFNGPLQSATPLFDGVEPTEFAAADRNHEPLAAQAGAMRALSIAVSTLPSAHLAGEFRDVTRGAARGGDTNFPLSYPTDRNDRGVPFSELNDSQKTLVRSAITRWVELPNSTISKQLMGAYTSEAALSATFIGLSGSPDLSAPGSYVRIDGPRLWIEFVVQPAVADPKLVHYHTLWRDKVADYGGEFGG